MKNLLTGGYLAGKRTYITAGVTVIGAAASYLVGDIGLVDALQLGVTGILGATVRASIAAKG